ncbi:MAG: cache domain-containing protein, partial [Candidatus Kariarchaeaceae archaeon]
MIEKISLKYQLLAAFTVISLLLLIVISTVAIGNISIVGSNTEEIATESLEEQIIRNMLHSSEENAAIIEKKAYNAATAVLALTEATKELFSSTADNYPYKSSFFDLNIDDVPNVIFNDTLDAKISLSASTYYHPAATVITTELNESISKSSYLDPVFKSLYNDYPEFARFKVAFENGGILRQYPASVISEDRAYNPTSDFWYNHGKNAPNRMLQYTPPTFDTISGAWVITVSQVVYDDFDNLVGVVGADLKLTSIQQKVDDIKFLESGYAFLTLINGW